MTVFHSHADTFTTPSGAIRLASSQACENQAFLYEQRVLALQFHLEATPDFVSIVGRNAATEPDSPWTQCQLEIEAGIHLINAGNQAMARLLESMISRQESSNNGRNEHGHHGVKGQTPRR